MGNFLPDVISDQTLRDELSPRQSMVLVEGNEYALGQYEIRDPDDPHERIDRCVSSLPKNKTPTASSRTA
jgi:hypothetical protein